MNIRERLLFSYECSISNVGAFIFMYFLESCQQQLSGDEREKSQEVCVGGSVRYIRKRDVV